MTPVVAPTVTIATAVATIASHDVGSSDNSTNDCPDDRAGWASNHGAGARADGDAFQCSSLRRDGCRYGQQRDESTLECHVHNETPILSNHLW